jgi:hypothetical protein
MLRRPMRAAALAMLVACGSTSKGPTSAAAQVATALTATLAAADHARAPWRCAAADGPAPVAEKLGAWEIADRTLRTPQRELAIGVFADAGGADPKTLAALARLREKLDKVDLVLALGGMGTTQSELEATLGAISHGVPVIALPGDLEAVTAETAAIAALRGKGAQVLDGRLVQWIETPTVAIATIPGTGAVERLVAADDGCAWAADDVARIMTELAGKPGLRIAATAEAPRELVAGEPVGELAKITATIDIVLHGPVRPEPSPDKTGGRDGARVGLSPGTADATARLPETRSPAAGLLTIHGNAWTWKSIIDR